MQELYLIGRHVAETPTPSLLLVREALESNIRTLQDLTRKAKVSNRPHAKGHKSVAIARRQIAEGAVGICCQKLSEAEVFVGAGIGEILLTNEIVDPAKLVRVCELAKRCRLVVVADSSVGVERLEAAASRAGIKVAVLVDLNVGQDRCGVSSLEDAVRLAEQLDASTNLELKGLQAYQGKLQHVDQFEARQHAVVEAMAFLREVLQAFRGKGLSTEIVSGGGTGTVEVDCQLGLLNDVQAGSYVVMDAQYGAMGGRGGGAFDLFRPAIFVSTQVISRTGDERCIVDAGLKALSSDAGHPVVVGMGADAFAFAGDEHGVIDLRRLSKKPAIGDRLQIIPAHCDTTINLYDRYLVVEDDRVVDIWRVDARGHVT